METFATGPTSGQRPRWLTYTFAVAITLAMLTLREDVVIAFGEQPMMINFMFPNILSALLGGQLRRQAGGRDQRP